MKRMKSNSRIILFVFIISLLLVFTRETNDSITAVHQCAVQEQDVMINSNQETQLKKLEYIQNTLQSRLSQCLLKRICFSLLICWFIGIETLLLLRAGSVEKLIHYIQTKYRMRITKAVIRRGPPLFVI